MFKEIIKQERETDCLVANVANVLNNEGISFDMNNIRNKIYLPNEIAPTNFSSMESAMQYLREKLPEDYEIHLYSGGKIKEERLEHYSGVDYFKKIGGLKKDIKLNLSELNNYKENSLNSAKSSNVIVHDEGLLEDIVKDALKNKYYLITGIHTQPIQDYFGMDHPGFNHAVIPIEIKDGNLTFAETMKEIEDNYITIPEKVFYDSMKDMGKNFYHGNTEGILIKKKQ